uniref:Uncharacterized protein MANES_03G063500 n=1 Tax=Rhizophora mucronata TaxID=61149 RepID=A0A2P2R195_RHIMU
MILCTWDFLGQRREAQRFTVLSGGVLVHRSTLILLGHLHRHHQQLA